MTVEITWAHVSVFITVVLVPIVIGSIKRRDMTLKMEEKTKQHQAEITCLKENQTHSIKQCEVYRATIHDKINERAEKHQFDQLDKRIQRVDQNVVEILQILAQNK